MQAVEAEQELLAIYVQAERVPDEVAEVVKPALEATLGPHDAGAGNPHRAAH